MAILTGFLAGRTAAAGKDGWTVASPRPCVYLAYRALLAHPLRRLRLVGSGLDRFRAAYVSEGLVPTATADGEIAAAAAACISCGLCEVGCELSGASAPERALGLHAVFRLYSRNSAELPLAASALEPAPGAPAATRAAPPACPSHGS